MSEIRLEDRSETIREAVPGASADAAVVVTELGNPSVLMVLLALVFWCHGESRRRSALVVSYAVAGLGLLLTVETLLGLPRPPEEVLTTSLEAAGYGFPSGHAFAAAVVYGGLVSAYDRIRDPRAVAGAAAIIAVVSLSRVVLGVHYLGDVLVGAALGLVFVAAMARLTRGAPVVGFAVAGVLAVPAVSVTDAAANAVLALGGSVGGLLTAGRIDRLPALRSRLEAAVLVAVGGAVAVGLRVLESTLEFAPLLVALYAVLVGWIVLAPSVVAAVAPGRLEPGSFLRS